MSIEPLNSSEARASSILDHDKTFANFDFGLDKRLTKAVAKLGYIYPTLVQVKLYIKVDPKKA